MATYLVHEFNGRPNEFGEVSWPAAKTTAVAASGTHETEPSTQTVIITTDEDSRISFDGNAVAHGIPVLALALNQFMVAGGVANTIKFL